MNIVGRSLSVGFRPLPQTTPLTLFDEANSFDEDRWITLGQVKVRRLVVVVHTWQEQDTDAIHVRIISAREATAHEVKQYEG